MSLDERRKGSKKKKKTRYGFGGYYFPGYHYYGQTDAVTDGGGGGGGDGGGGDGGGGTGAGAGTGNAMAKGGYVHEGKMFGANPPGPDDGAVNLDIGEYVIKKSSVNKYGRGLLDMINEGKVPAKKMKSLLG
jgi:hypothetical protein